MPVNAMLPAELPAGASPLVVQVGNKASFSGTVNVQ